MGFLVDLIYFLSCLFSCAGNSNPRNLKVYNTNYWWTICNIFPTFKSLNIGVSLAMSLKNWSPKGIPTCQGKSTPQKINYKQDENKTTAILIKILWTLSRTVKHMIRSCFIAIALNKFALILNYYYFYCNKIQIITYIYSKAIFVHSLSPSRLWR